jgi:predicted alpha/beta hydrolase
VRFCTSDGRQLVGTVFAPAGDPTSAVLFVPGVGVPAKLYHTFGEYVASTGRVFFTYDCRGIGASAPASLRGFDTCFEDWSEFDASAALQWLSARFPNLPVAAVSHSFGAVVLLGALGGKPVRKLVMIGPHLGYWGDYRLRYRMPMILCWHLFMPLVTLAFGYFPASRLGLGGDLPATPAFQWAARVQPAMRGRGAKERRTRALRLMDRIRAQRGTAIQILLEDDAFATAMGAARVRALIPEMAVETLTWNASMANRKRLGHFGFFSRTCASTLWPRLIALLP